MMGYEAVGGMLGFYPTDIGRVPTKELKGGQMWGWQEG
jgi:hypothetical protein